MRPGENDVELCQKIIVAAIATEILAVYLHNTQRHVDDTVLKAVVTRIALLRTHVQEIPQYNNSLHANLKRNFESKYGECKLGSLKRTVLVKPQFGDDYFYDVRFASRLLKFDLKLEQRHRPRILW